MRERTERPRPGRAASRSQRAGFTATGKVSSMICFESFIDAQLYVGFVILKVFMKGVDLIFEIIMLLKIVRKNHDVGLMNQRVLVACDECTFQLIISVHKLLFLILAPYSLIFRINLPPKYYDLYYSCSHSK